MFKKIKKIVSFLGIFLGFFASAKLALALEVTYPQIGNLSLNNGASFGDLACYLLGITTAIVISVSMIAIAIGGIYYLISYSRGKFTTEAKAWIKSGILGTLLTLCSVTILSTINPALTKCQLGQLSKLTFNSTLPSSNGQNSNVSTYQEIPIGKLTETLLTRTTDCYAFDAYGDPMQGKQEVDKNCSKDSECSSQQWCNTYTSKCNNFFPTYTDHDRADCITQLAEGAVKKATTVALLSDEIARLMQQCSCEGKCNPKCDPATGCKPAGYCGSGVCQGSCVGGACLQPPETKDCCPPGVKEKIEHGPIVLGMTVDGRDDTYHPYGEPSALPTAVDTDGDGIAEPVDYSSYDDPNRPVADSSCYGLLNYTNYDALRDRTLYVAPEFYDEAVIAAEHWNTAAGTNLFGDIISTSSLSGTNASNNNGLNEIFSSMSPPSGAVGALAWCQTSSYDPDEADIGIPYSTPSGDATTNSSVYDIQSLLSHEMGHVLGLKDQYDPKCTGATMYGYMGVGQLSRSIQAADINGLHAIYNPSTTNTHSGSTGATGGTEGPSGGSTGGGSDGPAGGTPGGNAGSPSGNSNIEYHGLDEWRCPNPIKHEGKPAEDPEYRECNNIANHVEEKIEVDNKEYTIINKKRWDKLSLIQQLNYYKPEIEDLSKTVDDDLKKLDEARTTLASCYLALPYIDLLKTTEITGKDQRIVLTEKTFSDPITNEKVDASKYCSGFNYNNSTCLKKCNDLCPITDEDTMEAYGQCSGESPEETKTCIDKAYKERTCEYAPAADDGSDETDPKTFEDCITSCQSTCVDTCSKKYLSNSGEYIFCTNQCYTNGQCVLDDTDKCLYQADKIVECTNGRYASDDQGNIDNCIDRAYLCKNGSDEYSGYQDCANSSATISTYTASSFYNNPTAQKCLKPYESPKETSDCYSSKNDESICRELCPETQKCPTDSRCGECTCDKIDEAISFSIPNESNKNNVGRAGFSSTQKEIKEYQMVGPQCNESSYNDDPLTFYCETNPKWWDDPQKEGKSLKPMGEERICPSEQEIPVGQTVDNARSWATKLINDSKTATEGIQKVMGEMLKIGLAIKTDPIQDYCKCPAKYENNSPICKTGCIYDYVSGFTEGSGYWCVDWCNFDPCKGSPCEQITNYISDLWNRYREYKIAFTEFYTTMIKEPRSDIIKQLDYSRLSTNNCSLANTSYGAVSRALSCTRVEDELVYPINMGELKIGKLTIKDYCYGTELGKITKQSYTDNWFCCQQFEMDPEINPNPIYNIQK